MSSTKNAPKDPEFYECAFCDFECYKNSDWLRHITTRKHKNQQKSTENQQKTLQNETIIYECLCGKNYKERSGLWRHRKKCPVTPNDLISEDIVLQLLTQNKQLQEQIIEICKDKSITNNTINNSNNNSHNKTFNLQVFLNETCKDAMNLTDFVNSLHIDLADLENVGKNGFVAGISSIILKNLKALDYTLRPVHCSDHKREVIYVKDANEWFNDSKEEPQNQKLKKAIKQIAHKNICMIPEWKTKYPDCVYSESKKSDLYNHIMYESMDHNDNNSDKIIKRIAKEVGIVK